MNLTQPSARSDRQFSVHPLALVESDDIGAGTRIWAFAHVMKGVHVGRHCNIGEHCYIETGAFLGDNVTVKNGVAVWAGVTVEDNVFLGPNCVLTNDPNPRAYVKKTNESLVPTRICAGATIGANATILCGATIGTHSFIGAGAVVIRSVPDFALIVGNPGRQIGWMCVCAQRLPLLTSAPLGSTTTCPHCGQSWCRTAEGLVAEPAR